MLLNTIGETVTRLMNLAVKECDGSWLTQLLLVLRSHVNVLRTLCAVVCQLVTRQANALADCHAHALAAILVHLNSHASCSAGITVQRTAATARDGPNATVTKTVPFVSYVLESLPLSTTVNMSFSLLFVVFYVIYAKMIGRELLTDENQTSTDQGLVVQQSVDGCVIIPDHVGQMLSYLGPKLVKDLRSRSSNLGYKESVVSDKFLSVERFLSSDSVRTLLEQNRMTFETWVQKEIEVVDDEDLSPEWLREYYMWVVFTRWHKPQSVDDSATAQMYIISILQVLASALLDFDVRYSEPHTCCHNTTRQISRLKQNGHHNISDLLQASRR